MGIISYAASQRGNGVGTPHSKKLKTSLEGVYLPTFLS